jgi:hypothetical protein
VVICGDSGGGKPEPGLFVACPERMGGPYPDCLIVEPVWDLHSVRTRHSAVGMLIGGTPEQELDSTVRCGCIAMQPSC